MKKISKVLFLIILILLAIFFCSSTIFKIRYDEVGVIQRFGKFVRTSQPGLNFKLPAGIEKVTKVRVTHVHKEEFGSDPHGQMQENGFQPGVKILTYP